MSDISSHSRLSGPLPTTVRALPLYITSGVHKVLLPSARAEFYTLLYILLLLVYSNGPGISLGVERSRLFVKPSFDR